MGAWGINRKPIWTYVLSGLIVLFMLGLYIETLETMPDNAVVIVDEYQRRYYPPYMHVEDELHRSYGQLHWSYVRLATAEDAHSLGYSPDPKSRDHGDFVGCSQRLLFAIIRGVFGLPAPRRWNEDGTWNW